MADNYCQSSTLIEIEPGKIEQAKAVVHGVCEKLEGGEDGYVGFMVDVEEKGVWIREEDSINHEHVESLIRALVEELQLDGIYVCSWAYTCSKQRVDEFGGGAFAVKKGKETVWIDAASEVRRIAAA
jgi:hypothetical protein